MFKYQVGKFSSVFGTSKDKFKGRMDDFKIGKVSPLFKNGERERILITFSLALNSKSI